MDLNRQVASLRGVAGRFGGGPIVVHASSGRGASATLESATAQARMTVANPSVANAAGPQREQTALDKAVAQLRATVNNPAATPEDIKKQLTAVRQAWEKVKRELAVAQAELTKLLAVRQEAQLLLMGQLN
jgi:chromosome segregation ATPase